MAERILMNEYKALSQEKWVNVEVSRLTFHILRLHIVQELTISPPPAQRRRHLQLDHRPHHNQPRLPLLRRLLPRLHALPLKLPLLSAPVPIHPSPLPPQYLRRRETLHIHPPRPRRRRNERRISRRALEPRSTR